MNAVLKDMKNRPAGYIRESNGRTVCRVSLREPAQIMLVFEDAAPIAQEMLPGDTERLFDCGGKKLRCAYVFRDETLLFVTDAAAKEAFREKCRTLQRMRIEKRREERGNVNTASQSWTVEPEKGTDTEMEAEKKAAIKEKGAIRILPHRRWPPPDWANACYLGGRWIEQGEARGDLDNEL